jgi:hypothetical protein
MAAILNRKKAVAIDLL